MVLLAPDAAPVVDVAAEIQRLKRERKAVVMAHYYQTAEIQEVADLIGDSLELARFSRDSDAEVIAFCGVHFMAETAKILAPGKIVVLPDLEAGCSLAESCPADEFARFRARHPGAVAVTYVNSSAAVKALSDICCTSSNAVEVVRSIPADRPVIFGPDRFLGDWVARETGRDLILWQGSCEVHERFSEMKIAALRDAHPGCSVLVHPECPAPIRALADVIGSTRRILEAVKTGDPHGCYLVVTEPGIIHQMRKVAPEATFLEAPAETTSGSAVGACSSCNECPHMKRNTLDKLASALRHLQPRIELEPALMEQARLPIDRMLAGRL